MKIVRYKNREHRFVQAINALTRRRFAFFLLTRFPAMYFETDNLPVCLITKIRSIRSSSMRRQLKFDSPNSHSIAADEHRVFAESMRSFVAAYPTRDIKNNFVLYRHLRLCTRQIWKMDQALMSKLSTISSDTGGDLLFLKVIYPEICRLSDEDRLKFGSQMFDLMRKYVCAKPELKCEQKDPSEPKLRQRENLSEPRPNDTVEAPLKKRKAEKKIIITKEVDFIEIDDE